MHNIFDFRCSICRAKYEIEQNIMHKDGTLNDLEMHMGILLNIQKTYCKVQNEFFLRVSATEMCLYKIGAFCSFSKRYTFCQKLYLL